MSPYITKGSSQVFKIADWSPRLPKLQNQPQKLSWNCRLVPKVPLITNQPQKRPEIANGPQGRRVIDHLTYGQSAMFSIPQFDNNPLARWPFDEDYIKASREYGMT
ncbi:hypothetical protein VNO77_02687 [Canavalia gladiata]|uniref:Uncharacterized protein n=1 Tax=Canavalia gladiata TaxID=3824 RepID=A0AAN9RBI0_CANGL